LSDETFGFLLDRMRLKACTKEDLELLETRLETNLKEADRERFADAINLFASNAKVNLHNKGYALDKKQPLILLDTIITPHCPQCVEEHPGVYVGLNMNVLISRNLSVRLNVCNGTQGILRQIVYKEKKSPLNTQPDFLVVECLKYTGKPLPPSCRKTFPVFPSRDYDICKHGSPPVAVSIKRWNLQLAYAMT